ncbi:PAS domain-containing protein, partial [Halomonas sp. BBD48]|nr:PAS domain-containing protein [Halomonas sp. BBD48]
MLDPTFVLSQASSRLGFLIWTATSSGADRRFIVGNPTQLLGVPDETPDTLAFDDDWPVQIAPPQHLRKLLLQKARAQGEARCRYAITVDDDTTCWLEERVCFQEGAWNGIIHRLTPAESALPLPPALTRMVRQLFDPLPDYVFLARRASPGAAFNFVYANPALLKTLRRETDAWLGHSPETIFAPADGRRLQQRLAECESLGLTQTVDDILHDGEREHHWHLTLTLLESDNT